VVSARQVRVDSAKPGLTTREMMSARAAALRTHRDRAMVLAMLLAGPRRGEVLVVRSEDVQVAGHRLGEGRLLAGRQ
jgi:integrase/recombinase XerD